MRPVHRGDSPAVFTTHTQALVPLEQCLGPYCSYCERRINNQLAVEHICSQNDFPELRLEWSNFLLTCTNCNSIKRWQALSRADCYWPDIDNTARAFQYQDGLVTVNMELTPEQQIKANQTIDLTGLDRRPGHHRLSPRDKRWQDRQDVWDIAQYLRGILTTQNTLNTRQNILRIALSYGFWSVWMTIFADDVDMQRRLIAAFPGTCQDCFDEETRPLPRPGGSL